MNYEELRTRNAEITRVLNSKVARDLVAKNPDAEWSCSREWFKGAYKVVFQGTVELGWFDRKQVDLLNCATSCDEDTLYVRAVPVEIIKNEVVYRIQVNAWQALRSSEIATLKSIGKIVRTKEVQPRRVRTRSVLMCGV